MKKTLKKMWICYGQNLYPDYKTISYSKKGSIKSLLEIGVEDWKWWKKRGWKCVKVNITFEEI